MKTRNGPDGPQERKQLRLPLTRAVRQFVRFVSPHGPSQLRFSSCISARLDLSYGGIKPGRLDGSRLQNAGSSVPRCSSEH